MKYEKESILHPFLWFCIGLSIQADWNYVYPAHKIQFPGREKHTPFCRWIIITFMAPAASFWGLSVWR